MRSKIFTLAALALTGLTSAGLAQASSSVQWQVTVGGPVGVAVYDPYPYPHQHRPVHTPRVYAPPPVVVLPAAPHYRQPTRWDVDGDGIPNRRDVVYNPVWDRDGDGVPNRYDRRDPRPGDRDGDGLRNRHDRHPNVPDRGWGR